MTLCLKSKPIYEVIRVTLSEFIKEYRSQHQLSQRQFAHLCGVSHGTINLFEREVNYQTGQRINPSTENLRKIASGVGLSLQELLSVVDLNINMEDVMPDARLVEMQRLFGILDDNDIEELLAIAHLKASRYGDRQNNS